MKPFLMGCETEYAVSGRNGKGPVSAETVYALVNDAIRKDRLWVPDVVGGRAMYLENASRVYLDSGAHPELATPECLTPKQIAAYDMAADFILTRARARVMQEMPDHQVTVAKCNIGPVYPDRFTWGTHESYTLWGPTEAAIPPLLPHLVSRMIYAGAGCLSSAPNGMGYELSQRARHLEQVSGSETTSNRPIFCTRIRKATDVSHADGWSRAHMIARDAQRAPFSTYLTFGTTGLLFMLHNEKRKVGQGLTLANPIQAVRTVSQCPWLKARVNLHDGRKLTALEIQQSYLAECEREVQKGGFPDWAAEVCRHWGETLATLAQDPMRMANRLDAYCKLMIYDHELRRAGYTWTDLHQAEKLVTRLREMVPEAVMKALLAEDPSGLVGELQNRYKAAVKELGANQAATLDRLRFAVRLQALHLNYHELGGLYDELAAAGQMHKVVLNAEDIERAAQEPPPGCRSAVRGEWIKTHREPGWSCDWRYLLHNPSGNMVDMRNPFSTERKTLELNNPAHAAQLDPEMRMMHTRLFRR